MKSIQSEICMYFLKHTLKHILKIFQKYSHLFCVLTTGPMTIRTQRGTGCRGPEVKTQKCMHKYYPDMYLILYCMTCFIVQYLIYVIYYACRFVN
jgi:hypothetical protein